MKKSLDLLQTVVKNQEVPLETQMCHIQKFIMVTALLCIPQSFLQGLNFRRVKKFSFAFFTAINKINLCGCLVCSSDYLFLLFLLFSILLFSLFFHLLIKNINDQHNQHSYGEYLKDKVAIFFFYVLQLISLIASPCLHFLMFVSLILLLSLISIIRS